MRTNVLSITLLAVVMASSLATASLSSFDNIRMVRHVKRIEDADPLHARAPQSSDSYGSDKTSGSDCPDKTSGKDSDSYGAPPSGSSRSSGEATMPPPDSTTSSSPPPDTTSPGTTTPVTTTPTKPQCTYTADDDGNWVLSEMPGVSGCPHQIVPPSGKKKGEEHGCNVVSTPSLIGVSALNCAHVCILTSNCKKVKPCNVQSNGLLINVSALNCADVKVLSTKRK